MSTPRIFLAMSMIALLAAATARLTAATIATEGFATNTTETTDDPTVPTYRQNAGFNDVRNISDTPTGTTGFGDAAASPTSTATSWVTNTSAIRLKTVPAMPHSGLVGSAQTGVVEFAGGAVRNAARPLLAAPPTASSYYLSALVIIPDANRLVDGDRRTLGFGASAPATNTFSIASGFHLGARGAATTDYLSVFAGGTNYDLLDLSGNYGKTYQLVLRLNVSASGNETLTAWYAANGDTGLTLGLTATDVGDIWSAPGDLDTFIVQQDSANTASTYVDEMRFGTTLGDVTAIPEPSSMALLLGLAAGALLMHRRRRG